MDERVEAGIAADAVPCYRERLPIRVVGVDGRSRYGGPSRPDNLSRALVDGRSLIDRLQYGVVLYDEHVRILLVNRYASNRLVRSRGVTLRDGALRCHDAVDQARLGQLLQAAAAGRGGTLFVRAAAEPPVMLLAVPLAKIAREQSSDAVRPDLYEPHFAIVLGMPDAALSGTLDAFATAYGLTPAERHVLGALAADVSPRELAASSGVSVRTVRTQLSSIYGKAGVDGQRQLLAQLLLFPPFAID